MGTALVLLFLLALGAIPGALLPQRSLNESKVDAVHRRASDHRAVAGPSAGVRRVLQLLVHRDLRAAVHLAGGLPDPAADRARPQPACRSGGRAQEPQPAAQTPHRRGDRRAAGSGHRGDARDCGAGAPSPGPETDDATEISAEKGYLREFGNIVFHFSLLGLLVAVAAGKLFGYEGNVIVIADGGPGFCSASPAAFDSFRAGNTVDGTSLYPICLRVNDFQADYLPSGQAASFAADIDYQAGADLTSGTWRPYRLEVNHPLRVGGDRVYLQGHGYAPTFTVTFPDGQTRTQTLQWRPDDPITLLSSGVMRFDPPGGTYPDAGERRKNQIAIQGPVRAHRAAPRHPAVVELPGAQRPRRRRRHLQGRHRAGHRHAAVAVHPRPGAHRAGPADQEGAGQPRRRRVDAPRRRHHRAVRRRGAVHQRAGVPRPRPGVGAGVRADDDGRAAGVARGAAAPGLDSDRPWWSGYA